MASLARLYRAGASRRGMKIVAPLCVALLAVACENAPPPRDDGRPNFVLILVDTLRADHVGAYGYERDTTPFIDSLSARGLRFENAYAQAPWTVSSMASMWTSTYPSEAGAHANEDDDGLRDVGRLSATKMRRGAQTLAGALAEHGYETIAVVNNPFASDEFGLLKGFGRTGYNPGYHAEQQMDVGLRMIRRERDAARPFFIYIHLTDVHEPTAPPSPYDTMYPTMDGSPHEEAHQRWSFGRGKDLGSREFRAFRSHKVALYDGALRFVDDQIRRFLAELEKQKLAANTVIVIASDHGEEFWDNVEFERSHSVDPRGVYGIGHGHSMSHQLLHVPLVISGPGVAAARVHGQVRNLDIAPTLLALAGIPPLASMRGIDLIKAARARRFPPLVSFSEDIAYGGEAKCIQTRRYKLVRFAKAKTERTEFLFRTGGGEDQVLKGNAAECRRLRRMMGGVLVSIRPENGGPVSPDAARKRQLRALGYLD